ncbi:hypothetical protein BD779DRAFT_1001588 [Infundibulicybe gibba]|nr:hypothetical protein BD779DRAFT_1001588 [Infundibulicybe gibba]
MAEQKPPDGIQLGPALEFILPPLHHASLFLLSSAVFLACSIGSLISNNVASPHYILYMPLTILLYIVIHRFPQYLLHTPSVKTHLNISVPLRRVLPTLGVLRSGLHHRCPTGSHGEDSFFITGRTVCL